MADTTAKCKKCGKPLTAEDQLLSAIFGQKGECSACYQKSIAPKCTICGSITQLTMNGEPRCARHMMSKKKLVNH